MTHLVLIVRNSYEGVHSGQIAFPGGKWETEDENFSVTLRETHEEVGIHPDKMEIIKFLRLPISLQVTLWFILFWNL
jgi:8-oxo-dGTP pyrophosphatase MutT (NUDIX family)